MASLNTPSIGAALSGLGLGTGNVAAAARVSHASISPPFKTLEAAPLEAAPAACCCWRPNRLEWAVVRELGVRDTW